MRDIILSLVVFGLLPKCFARPDIGLMVFCWLSYMNPHKLCWGFALAFPFAQVTALATLAGLLIWKEPKRIPWAPTNVLLLLFLLWMSFTTLFAFNELAAWYEWNTVWKIQLMTFLIMMIMTTKERINNLVWVMALSLGFYGVKGGIFTLVSGGGNRVWGPSGSFIGGNNEIGLAMIMAIPLLRYLQLSMTKVWGKHCMSAAIILSFICVLGTQSRGALIGIAAMLGFLLLKSRNRFPLLLLLAITIPATLSFMPDSWYARMQTIRNYEKDGSAMGRINAWHTAVNVAKDRVVGCGYKCLHTELPFALYAPNPNDVHDAHSIYFEVLAEHGFIGLILFLLIAFTAWRTASKTIRLVANNPGMKWSADLCSMIQVSFVGYGAGGMFLGLAMFDLYYNLIAVVIACNVYVRKYVSGTVPNDGPAAVPASPRRLVSFVKASVRNPP
jgi:probable O-glycosylation ligase (exosortase A-associated)